MKKSNRTSRDAMRREYDFASMKGGVRGKYVRQYRAGSNLVLLDPEVAQAFPTDDAVNETLRAVLSMAKVVRLPNKSLRPARRSQRGKMGSQRQEAARG